MASRRSKCLSYYRLGMSQDKRATNRSDCADELRSSWHESSTAERRREDGGTGCTGDGQEGTHVEVVVLQHVKVKRYPEEDSNLHPPHFKCGRYYQLAYRGRIMRRGGVEPPIRPPCSASLPDGRRRFRDVPSPYRLVALPFAHLLKVVRKGGFEPPRSEDHEPLKPARLPVSPLPQKE